MYVYTAAFFTELADVLDRLSVYVSIRNVLMHSAH